MAALSDQLLLVTIVAYLLTMVVFAAEYALRERPARAGAGEPALAGAERAAAAPHRAPLISAEPVAERPPQEGAVGGRPGGALGGRLGQIAVGALALAAVLQLATTLTRAFAAGRVPWGNMYEYALTATLVAVAAWFWLLHRHTGIRHTGLYVALVNAVLLGLVGMIAYTPVEPLVPALDSAWLLIHVAAAATATGLFLVGFIAAVMYLIRSGYDAGKRRFPYPLGERLPGAATVERLGFRVNAVGFPIWTFAVAAGSIWAEAAWGRYWGWDPKEVWAFVTWVVYAAYLHARATPSVKRSVVAWLAVAGWITMTMNLFGVNLFFEGLHSYA